MTVPIFGRAVDIFLSLGALGAGMAVTAVLYWLLLEKRVRFAGALRLVVVAGALNKVMFTATGYAAVIALLKKKGIDAFRAFGSCAALELFVVGPWVVAGVWSGAAVASRAWAVGGIAVALVVGAAVFSKRRSLGTFLRESFRFAGGLGRRVPALVVLGGVTLLTGTLYYSFLFAAFDFHPSLIEAFKIAAIAFSVGYLSPLPAGIGVKEGGVVALLMHQGLGAGPAVGLAVLDRILCTAFYLVCLLVAAPGILCKNKELPLDDFS